MTELLPGDYTLECTEDGTVCVSFAAAYHHAHTPHLHTDKNPASFSVGLVLDRAVLDNVHRFGPTVHGHADGDGSSESSPTHNEPEFGAQPRDHAVQCVCRRWTLNLSAKCGLCGL